MPCPPFTVAGRQLGATDERDLFAWAVELCGTVKPRALLLENVRGLSLPRFAAYRQRVLDRLAELGYAAGWRLLHASDYGVPQLRPRFVLVAMRPADFAFFTLARSAADAAHRRPGAGRPDGGERLARRRRLGRPGERHRPHDRRRFQEARRPLTSAPPAPSGPGESWASTGSAWPTTAPAGRRPGLPAAPANLRDGRQAAGLGHREYRWEFTGRKTANYRQIGNAFPPPVARALGERHPPRPRPRGRAGRGQPRPG